MLIMHIVQIAFHDVLDPVHPIDQAVPVQPEIVGRICVIAAAKQKGI